MIVPRRSLRRRITLTVIAIAALLLVVVGVVVGIVLRSSLDRDQQTRLTDRAARADLLISQGAPPAALASELDGHGVRVQHTSADGTPLDGEPAPPPAPGGPDGDGPDRRGRGPDGPGAGAPGRGGPAALQVVRTLPDGTRLVLSADPGEVDAVIGRFRITMLVTGAVGLLLGAAALMVGVTRSLRPLDTMTDVARAITAGDRSRRLRPERSDTEIGRTAAAFDGMLDALDEAQRRAEASARDARAAERAALAAAEEARRSEATTRRFLSDAAHELRTPLAGTQALAETLVAEPDDDRAAREELAITIVRETSRAATLVSDMLDLARIEGGLEPVRRRVDLVGLAAEQAERTRLLAPEVTVTMTPARDDGDETGRAVLEVLADPDRITQVLANLLDNARRHTAPGGRITVEAGPADDGEESVEVTVRNTGEPVAPEDRERIFDRLVRLDAARTRDAGGAGLGLSIARALARAHGGDVTYRATEDGSAFTLSLPL